jgi:hypothetical protein
MLPIMEILHQLEFRGCAGGAKAQPLAGRWLLTPTP